MTTVSTTPSSSSTATPRVRALQPRSGRRVLLYAFLTVMALTFPVATSVATSESGILFTGWK